MALRLGAAAWAQRRKSARNEPPPIPLIGVQDGTVSPRYRAMPRCCGAAGLRMTRVETIGRGGRNYPKPSVREIARRLRNALPNKHRFPVSATCRDRCIWRQCPASDALEAIKDSPENHSYFKGMGWCCERGLNSRPLHYQWSALPLSYRSRIDRPWCLRCSPVAKVGGGVVVPKRRPDATSPGSTQPAKRNSSRSPRISMSVGQQQPLCDAE